MVKHLKRTINRHIFKIPLRTEMPKYKLRFFFDYNCGGCLWANNDAAFEGFGFGTLDAGSFNFEEGKVVEPKLILSDEIRRKVVYLDKRFSESLNWDDPSGASLWNDNEWASFHIQTRELHNEITAFLGTDFEVIYKQEH
jgi:hypothetical protein